MIDRLSREIKEGGLVCLLYMSEIFKDTFLIIKKEAALFIKLYLYGAFKC